MNEIMILKIRIKQKQSLNKKIIRYTSQLDGLIKTYFLLEHNINIIG